MTIETKNKTEEMNQEQFVAMIGKRYAEGDSLGEIFGVNAEFLNACEVKAYELFVNEQFDAARVIVEGVLALDPGRDYAQMLLGNIALKQRNLDEAILLLADASARTPDDKVVQLTLSEAYILAGDGEKAQKILAGFKDQDDQYARRAQILYDAAENGEPS